MNYTELSDLITEYTENQETSFAANKDRFIKLAEERIFGLIQFPDFRKTSTSSLTASQKFIATPDDYISTYSLGVNNGTAWVWLLNKDVNFLREAYPDETEEGTPEYYATWDEDTLIVAPTPDSGYTVQLAYYYKPTSIVDSATSWLGDNAELLLLYACLCEAYRYMKGDSDLMQEYETLFMEEAKKWGVTAEGRNRRDDYRSGQNRREAY